MVELVISADLNELNRLLTFFNNVIKVSDISESSKMQLELSIEEIFVNIVNYGFKEDKTTDNNVFIVIELKENPSRVIITFKDKGIPFNPLKSDDPDLSLSIEDREIGGLGILLVKKNVDKMDYEYKDGENILTLVKFL
ncbi:MAG: ATP-binding protein [Methanobrevibacter sp.]|jgi:anti-sigma regulatory factor (Ser/Thr protein kinase)|nr:ATP-binding protein [Methanobrevibacter sp.]